MHKKGRKKKPEDAAQPSTSQGQQQQEHKKKQEHHQQQQQQPETPAFQPAASSQEVSHPSSEEKRGRNYEKKSKKKSDTQSKEKWRESKEQSEEEPREFGGPPPSAGPGQKAKRQSKEPASQPPVSATGQAVWGQRQQQQQQPTSQPPVSATGQTVWGQRQQQQQPTSQRPVSATGQPVWGQRQQQQQPTSQPPVFATGQPVWSPRQQQQQPTSQPPVSATGQPVWGQRQQQQQQPTSYPPVSASGQSVWGQRQQQQQPASQPPVSATGQTVWGQRQQQQPTSQPPVSATGQSVWGQRQQQQQQASVKPISHDGSGDAPKQSKKRQQQEGRKETSEQQVVQRTSRPEVRDQSVASTQLTEYAPRITAQKKSGRPIKVATNFYPMIISNFNMIVCQYDVTFEPDKPKYLLRPVWRKFSAQHFGGRITVFDGVKNVYSKNELTSDSSLSGSVTVVNPENNREKEFNVSIKLVQRIDFSVFKNYREKMLQDRRRTVLPEAEIMVLDIILKNFAAENYIQSNRCFFRQADRRQPIVKLSEVLNMRYGFFQSAFLGYKPYVIFDIAHKPFYRSCPCVNIVREFQNWKGELNIEELNQFIRTMKVQYELPNNPESRRIYRVNKVVDNAKRQKFQKDDGSSITVENYFLNEKNIRLQCPELPLLWVGPTQKNIYLPMEFCEVIEDQVYKGAMNPSETREMVRNATQNARERRKCVDGEMAAIQFSQNEYLKEFGLSISGEMEIVEARVLDAPTLLTSKPIYVRDGVWNANDFLKPMTLTRWCILNLDRSVRRDDVRKLQSMIMSRGKALNMNPQNPSRDPIDGDISLAFIKRTFSQLKDMDIVFVIVPESKGGYSRVKTVCETQEGVLTQCIKKRTLSQDERKISTTIDNLLMKVNAKLGGKNHTIDGRSLPECLKGNTMIVGADVTHPSPGSKMPSVAAVAVSCDPNAFQYGTSVRVQTKEIIKNLDDILESHIKYFQKTRNANPEKIFFFRDGVSEGQLNIVFTEELRAMKNVCRKYGDPKITFVVVQKRHHTRFYPTSQKDETGKNYNVPVGTCVDTDVVHPRDLDFYLVSHASILGTARPTRYRLLYDENKLTDDELEKLSYYLCHMYSRCKRSVSYPSPTYHAHLAAFRARAYLEELRANVNDDLNSIQRNITDRISYRSPMFFV